LAMSMKFLVAILRSYTTEGCAGKNVLYLIYANEN